MIQKIELSIVIINFRTPSFVMDCLASLLPELDTLNAKVVVVDNHSQDDSSEQIKAWIAGNDTNSKIHFVQSESNGGFSAGNNLGIKTLAADYYLLLNSDTLVRPTAIHRLLDTIKSNPQAGLVSPGLEWPDGRGQESCFRYQTPLSELMGAAKTGLIDRCLSKYIVPMAVQSKEITAQWTSFACVLIRHDVFAEVGLLDDGYFMYFEDSEFCYRAGQAGWKILHNPAARVVHLRGGSSPVKENTKQRKRLPRYFYESRARFFYQSGGRLNLILANLLWGAGRLISKSRQLLGRRDKAAIDKQWRDNWIHCCRPLGQYTHPDSGNNNK